MSDRVALVTGACGEMGHLLIPTLNRAGYRVVALDLAPLDADLAAQCVETMEASILEEPVLSDLFDRHRFGSVFHLAAVLSAKAEKDPDLAHRVNVGGTYGLLRLCLARAGERDGAIRFLLPSSIAVYGLPDAAAKRSAGAVKESEWTMPTAMYGCNKLYCELLGAYLGQREPEKLDFRAIRFPGLISADTLPTGGTTDYAPEMIHAAAQGRPYACFVGPETRLPFMTMPDGVGALVQLAEAEPAALSRRVYNTKGFSASAAEIRDETLLHFAGARIDFQAVPERQALVDTWPADIDDTAARRDWGLAPRHELAQALDQYLVPAMRRRYAGATSP